MNPGTKASNGEMMRPTYQYIDGSHTFYELKLAGTPAEMVEAAGKTAAEDISRAYGKLMHLNYGNAGYAGLQDLYSRAVAQYHSGRDVTNLAQLATGNEALCHWGEAATAFTRAQALAKQVYEALVPPPTSPTDLDLEPFGGDWAKWETRIK
jgi:hypothetical protein